MSFVVDWSVPVFVSHCGWSPSEFSHFREHSNNMSQLPEDWTLVIIGIIIIIIGFYFFEAYISVLSWKY
jgi:hypothetical protein